MKATGLLARMFVRSSSTRKPFTRRFVVIGLTTSKNKDLTLIAHPVHCAPRKLAPFESGEHVEQLLLLDCPPLPRPHLCHVRLQSYWVCRRTERAFAIAVATSGHVRSAVFKSNRACAGPQVI